jgi:hypothetical protein
MIGISCTTAEHATLKSKNKDWNDMNIRGLVFQCAKNILSSGILYRLFVKCMISGREQITFREDGDDVRFVLDQNDLLAEKNTPL